MRDCKAARRSLSVLVACVPAAKEKSKKPVTADIIAIFLKVKDMFLLVHPQM